MALTTFIIPLQNVPQQFTIPLAGNTYLMTCKWNDAPDAGWVLDIADANTGNVLAACIPLITGADCLSGLEYLGIGGTLTVSTNGDPSAVPTLDNLGTDSNLFFNTDVVTNG